MSSIDFSELIISKKGVISSDNQPSGNIIGEREDEIIVEEGRSKVYTIPKSKISGYDGAQIQLGFPYSELSNYKEKSGKADDYVDNAFDSASDSINKVSSKVGDIASGTVNKAKDVFRDKDDTTTY